jgi:DNA (cytosine-5)-methyltransferase 1
MARIIREVDPAFTFIENSPMLRTRGLGTVLNDLNSMGFDAKWGCIPASAVGANHKRDRIWIVGKSKRKGLEGQRSKPRKEEVSQLGDSGTLAHTENSRDVWRQWQLGFAEQEHDSGGGTIDGRREWWEAEPNVGRVDHGVAARVDRLKAIGNGQVPLCAATAWRLLSS